MPYENSNRNLYKTFFFFQNIIKYMYTCVSHKGVDTFSFKGTYKIAEGRYGFCVPKAKRSSSDFIGTSKHVFVKKEK